MFSTIPTTLINSGKHYRIPLPSSPLVLTQKLPLATSYFYYLPVDDDPSEPSDPTSGCSLTWPLELKESESSEFSFSSASSSSSSLSSDFSPLPPPKPTRTHAVIEEILAQNDLYLILGLSRTSDLDRLTLRRAYLSRSRACHPESVFLTSRRNLTEYGAANFQGTQKPLTLSRK